jgi:hypothetical protein
MRVPVLLAFILVLPGCPYTVNQLNRLPQTEPLAQPVLFNQPGPLVHAPTGFVFPERYDNFQRVTAYRYDTAGLNIEIGYNDRRDNCVVAATYYLYPTPRMSFIGTRPDVVASIEQRWLRNEFARAKAEIEQHHPRMHSAVEAPASTPSIPQSLQGSRLSYREEGYVSQLQLFVLDRKWFLKYRFTYPEACERESASRLAAILPRLPWAAQQGDEVGR